MIDKEQFDYTMNKIRQNRGLYQMANENLAKETFPYIQQIFPQARLIQCGIYQWIAADLKATKRIAKDLRNMKINKEKELDEINNAIAQLDWRLEGRK